MAAVLAFSVHRRLAFRIPDVEECQFGYRNLCQDEQRWMWWCHLPQDRELTSAELVVVSNEEMRKKLLERHWGWHEPIGTFLNSTAGIIKTNTYEVAIEATDIDAAFAAVLPRPFEEDRKKA